MGKLTQKAETFQILRNTGKSIQDVHRMAGFQGEVNGSAPYKIEGIIRNYALTDPKLLETSEKVARHILEIAEEALAKGSENPQIQA